MHHGKVIVIAGPSGSGKTTVINRLVERAHSATRLTTATTRLPRPGEVDGDDYFFFSMEKFDAELGDGNIAGQRFVPLYGGVHYGIYLPELKKKLEKFDTVFAPVDITGAEYLKSAYGALTIFIMPESFAEYRTRIHARSPEMSPREFDMRMKISDQEIHAHSPRYDYRVVNAGGLLTETVDGIVEIMKKEGYSL